MEILKYPNRNIWIFGREIPASKPAKGSSHLPLSLINHHVEHYIPENLIIIINDTTCQSNNLTLMENLVCLDFINHHAKLNIPDNKCVHWTPVMIRQVPRLT